MVPGITHLLHGTVFEIILEMQELTDIILYILLINTRNNIHHILMKVEAVVVMKYHQI